MLYQLCNLIHCKALKQPRTNFNQVVKGLHGLGSFLRPSQIIWVNLITGTKTMNHHHPKWILMNISEFLDAVHPIAVESVIEQYSQGFQRHIDKILIQKETQSQIQHLISCLMEDIFLVSVENYDRRSLEPVFLKSTLLTKFPRFETLFSSCIQPCRISHLSDFIQIQITRRDLIVACL
jgi:hypothetical protein